MAQLNNPDEKSCPTVVLQSVIDEIKHHGRSSMDREVCGVLIGNLCLTEEDQWRVSVEGRIEGKYADNQLGSVTFTSETWDYIHEQLEAYYPNRRIVGWYHTHPGFGIFLSAMDVYIHSNFFSPHWQVAYVYDPQAETDGWFLWGNEKPEIASVMICDDIHKPNHSSEYLIDNPAESPSEGIIMKRSSHSTSNKIGIMDYLMLGACIIMMVFMILALIQLDRNLANLEKRLEKVEKFSGDWEQFEGQINDLSNEVSTVQSKFDKFQTEGLPCTIKMVPTEQDPQVEPDVQPLKQPLQASQYQPKPEPVPNTLAEPQNQAPNPPQSSPGQAQSSPGQAQTAPGQAQTAPGQAQTAPGQAQTAPSQAQTAPGQAQTAPSQAQTAPGQAQTAPSQNPAPVSAPTFTTPSQSIPNKGN